MLPIKTFSAMDHGWLGKGRCAGLLLLLLMSMIRPGELLSAAPVEPVRQLKLIENLYHAGEDFRAETEVLRFLHFFPRHGQKAAVELTRAKLYYRSGRYPESSLMLFSLLDRNPRGGQAAAARRLLGLSLVRRGLIGQAEEVLPPPPIPQSTLQQPPPAPADATEARRPPPETLAALRMPPVDAASPETARAWSTWLPGTGFFVLNQPGRAWAAMGLNLLFTGAAVAAWNDQMPGVALAFLLTEVALYRGGRQAVYDEAQAMLARREAQRRAAWTRAHGEALLLNIAIRFPLGGD